MAANSEKLVLDNAQPDQEQKHAETSSHISSDEELTSGINEKALLRKIDWKLLPAVSVLYLLSFLDRSNGTHFFPNP